jgi:glycerol-3-phosphate dehydrogenase
VLKYPVKQKEYDIIIIGAGVSGANIARKLSQYKLNILVVDKEPDQGFGVSKANSGIIHGGFHHSLDSLKARLEIQGNLMFDQLKKELHFPFERTGILVAAFNEEEMKTVDILYRRGVENKVIGIELCSRERMLSLEPKLNKDVIGGLHAPGGGIIEPYRYVYALCESAKVNGVSFRMNFHVKGGNFRDGKWTIFDQTGESVKGRVLINSAGLFADEISRAFGAEEFKIVPRKGEEYLMDRNAKAKPGKVIFPVPAAHSKGMLVIPTVEGTTMVGPTAEMVENKQDLSTSRGNFEKIFYSARRLIHEVSERDVITSFTGLRPTMEGNDFFIDISKKVQNFIQVAGIQSPGLTASPAIGLYVKDLVKALGIVLEEKTDWQPEIKKVKRLREMSAEEIQDAWNEDPRYGNVVCRCEKVSEAEIVEAIRQGHGTLDGVKFFTRAQMGRCQGGFCTDRIMKIIARETNSELWEIQKKSKGSEPIQYSLNTHNHEA